MIYRALLTSAVALSLAACQPASSPLSTVPSESAEATPQEVVAPTSESKEKTEAKPFFDASELAQIAERVERERAALPPIELPEGVRLDDPINHPPSLEDGQALFEALYGASGLVFVHGAGTRRLVVFSDPGSMFDMAFHQMLKTNEDNLDATVVVLPIVPANQPSVKAKVETLFCAQSPETAWRSWFDAAAVNSMTQAFSSNSRIPEAAWQGFLSRNLVSQEPCAPRQRARLEQFSEIAARLGVDHTPTVVFEHGQAWPGPIMDRNDLEKVWWYVDSRLKSQAAPLNDP